MLQLELVKANLAAPSKPASSPHSPRSIRTRAAGNGKARSATCCNACFANRSQPLTTPPPITIISGIEDIDQIREADPQIDSHATKNFDRELIAFEVRPCKPSPPSGLRWCAVPNADSVAAPRASCARSQSPMHKPPNIHGCRKCTQRRQTDRLPCARSRQLNCQRRAKLAIQNNSAAQSGSQRDANDGIDVRVAAPCHISPTAAAFASFSTIAGQ